MCENGKGPNKDLIDNLKSELTLIKTNFLNPNINKVIDFHIPNMSGERKQSLGKNGDWGWDPTSPKNILCAHA